MKFYLVTCDKTQWILRATSHLYEKYWPKQDINILGWTKCPQLPENYKFLKLGNGLKQDRIETWTKDLYNVIKNETDEFIVFGLDDYLPIAPFNKEIFDDVMEIMESDKTIGRYELGWGAQEKETLDTIQRKFGYDIIKYRQDTLYRVSCQISVWRTEWLLKFLNNDWTPWQFEVEGSRVSNNDGNTVIGTRGSHAFRWIEESALSGRYLGKINVLGLPLQDIHDLVKLKFLDQCSLQYGMSKKGVDDGLKIHKIGKKYISSYINNQNQ